MSRHSLAGAMHPVVVLAYGIAALVLVVAFVQPVQCSMAFLLVSAYGLVADGAFASVRRLTWQLPMVAFFAILNCAFAQLGVNYLHIGSIDVNVEGLVFGLCMGMMLATSLMVFSFVGDLVSSDEALSLTGGRFPTLSFLLSMTLGLVPKLKARSVEVQDAMNACTSARRAWGDGCSDAPFTTKAKRTSQQLSRALRNSTTLMANSLEDSLVTASSMRARGWGSAGGRNAYARLRFTVSDGWRLAAVVAFCAIAAAAAAFVMSGSSIYPDIVLPDLPFAYVVYGSFFLLPFVPMIAEGRRWTR